MPSAPKLVTAKPTSRRGPSAAPARPVAGERYPAGMQRYIVTLKDTPGRTDAPADRESFVRSRQQRVGRFRRELLRLIRDEGLQLEVAEVTRPTAFNMLSIVATKELATRVGRLDDVESVYRDRGLLRLVR